MKQIRKASFFDVMNILIIGIITFICLYPFWMALIASLNQSEDFMRGGVYWWPRKLSFENYRLAFNDSRLFTGMKVSAARTILGTITALFFTSVVAYGLSRPDVRGRKITFNLNLFTMFFSGGLVPSFLVIKQLGLLNSFWVYIIPSLYSVYNMIIMMNFFKEIPEEIHESAVVDGAGEFRIYLSLYLPVSKAVLSTVALWVGVWHWNSYFDCMLYTTDASLQTLSSFLYRLVKEAATVSSDVSYVASESAVKVTYGTLKYAAIVISTLPVLIIFPCIQRYFDKGILLGSIKA